MTAILPAATPVTTRQESTEAAAVPFVTAWKQGHFSQYMLSSLIVALIVVVVTTLLALLAGYGFAQMRFRGANILFYVLLLGMMIPVEGFVVPLYFDLRGYNLTSTYFALALPQIAQSLGFSTYWIRNTFRAYPQSIVEAARIDGAGDSRILWGVLVPSSRPALLTMVLLLFMWAWNEFLLALIMVAGSSASTAPIGLTLFKGQYTTSYNLTAAAGVLVALPIVILFVFLQRHFINGMVSGALRE